MGLLGVELARHRITWTKTTRLRKNVLFNSEYRVCPFYSPLITSINITVTACDDSEFNPSPTHNPASLVNNATTIDTPNSKDITNFKTTNSKLTLSKPATMSFGFGVGDFLAVSELAWNLYRYCYVVARGAPQEFQLLLQEITSLSQSIQLLQEEAKDPNSTLVRSGDARIVMVKEMMGRVEVTLRELEKHAKKYEKLGDNTRAKRKQIWSKFKWSVDATNLDSLRNKVIQTSGFEYRR